VAVLFLRGLGAAAPEPSGWISLPLGEGGGSRVGVEPQALSGWQDPHP